MTQYSVTGMSCAACSARVEKAVRGVDGVTECAVSLLTNSMGVEGSASPEAIIQAVTDAGYGAVLRSGENRAEPSVSEDSLADRETPRLVRRLIVSAVFLLLLMYVSMGHTMLGMPLPAWFSGNHAAVALMQMLLAAIIMVINQRFFVSGFKALIHRAPNMDTLVALGSSVSFLWSIYVLFLMTDDLMRGQPDAAMDHMMQLYFESAAMILTLITVGKTLEARAKGKTTNALRSLMQLRPKTALILENDTEREIPAEQITTGMTFVLRPGMQIPADGIVTDGSGAVDESALTGESIPVDKAGGDTVSAGTMNLSGYLVCRATKTGEDTKLSQIIRMVGDAAATKAPIAKIADRVSGVFVPTVIGIALLTAAVWLLLGKPVGYALARGVSVLVISCPCALGLATPVAIMVGSGVGARHGVLYKTAASLEETGRITTVALDKTGTVTEGKPRITDVFAADGIAENELLRIAAAVEQHSEHPLAGAVMAYTAERGIEPPAVTEFRAMTGSGVTAFLDGKQLTGGSIDIVRGMSEKQRIIAENLANDGKTPLCFLRDGEFCGMLAAADVLKPDSAAAIAVMREMGLEVVMLTGDNPRTAEAIGRQAGVDRVIAGVKPDGKERVICELQEKGKVCMIGDGINDAPALTRADVGIAIGAGTDVALDAADVVLVQSRLSDAAAAIQLSRKTLKNIRENLFWAFIYNVIGIPLAAGVLVRFGLTLNPMFGAAAMSLSSFCVVSNALRLNLFKPKLTAEHTLPSAAAITENHENTKGTVDSMKTTLEIKGMMCPHCEAHVRKALENMEGVTVLRVSHEDAVAEIETANAVAEDAFRAVITDAGYELTGIR